jgi:hypothetical protein
MGDPISNEYPLMAWAISGERLLTAKKAAEDRHTESLLRLAGNCELLYELEDRCGLAEREKEAGVPAAIEEARQVLGRLRCLIAGYPDSDRMLDMIDRLHTGCSKMREHELRESAELLGRNLVAWAAARKIDGHERKEPQGAAGHGAGDPLAHAEKLTHAPKIAYGQYINACQELGPDTPLEAAYEWVTEQHDRDTDGNLPSLAAWTRSVHRAKQTLGITTRRAAPGETPRSAILVSEQAGSRRS